MLPLPPPELAARVGGSLEDYASIAHTQRALIEMVLPAGFSYQGKAVLDFGCGPGRTLSAFAAEATAARFAGCDVHAQSIEWAARELSPPFEFFICAETPPLDQPEGSFDLVWAMSVFTHITRYWAEWLAELHRILRPGGIAVVSVLGTGMAEAILSGPWDERIGMAALDLHKDWTIGGPSVLLSEWWLHEHWGRAFEILRYWRCMDSGRTGHDLVTLRPRDVAVTPELLRRRSAGDARELAALEYNVELLMRQQESLGAELAEVREAARGADDRARAELDGTRAELERVRTDLEQARGESLRAQGELAAVRSQLERRPTRIAARAIRRLRGTPRR